MPSINYLWDPIEDNVIAEFDDDGKLIVDYTTEPEYHGDVISQHRDGETNVFYSDPLGLTVAVTNQAGDVVATRAYSVFGETTESTGDLIFPFQYIGQKGYYLDVETNTYYVRRRPYEPASGRWLSADPIWSTNLYTYAENSPSNYTDPSGLVCESPFGVVYIPGRGSFTEKVVKTENASFIGSTFSVTWKADSAAFQPACCCCEDIAFILIGKSTPQNPKWRILDFPIKSTLEFWHADPCKKNPEPYALGFAKILAVAGGVPVGKYQFEGEICVYCRAGLEGSALADSLTIYGCATWTHDFVRGKDGKYSVSSKVTGFDAAPSGNLKALITADKKVAPGG